MVVTRLNLYSVWSPDRNEILTRLTAQKRSGNEISEIMGVSKSSIQRQQRRLKIVEKRAPSRWTPELTEGLRALTAKKINAVLIGDELGFTKNAIIGKQNRLRLRGQYRAVRARPRRLSPTELRAVPDNVKPLGVRLIDLELHHCRFPLDKKDDDGLMMYCGNPVYATESWCVGHCKRVFNQI